MGGADFEHLHKICRYVRGFIQKKIPRLQTAVFFLNGLRRPYQRYRIKFLSNENLLFPEHRQ